MNPRTIALLVFLGITVLTAVAVLAAAVGWLPDADERLVSWGIPAVLGEIVATVIIYLKTPTHTIRVNLQFDGLAPAGVDLIDDGSFAVLDNSGKQRMKGTVLPILGPGGYQVTLPAAVEPTDTIMLTFRERNGGEWGVRPFLPFVQTREAVRFEESEVRV
jgi:hypothetical protein